jgi:hypothetical protein
MTLLYRNTHPDIHSAASRLATGNRPRYVGLEVYAPDLFEAPRFVEELVSLVGERDSTHECKLLKLDIRAAEKPREATAAYLIKEITPAAAGGKPFHYVVQVNHLDSTRSIDPKVAGESLFGINDAVDDLRSRPDATWLSTVLITKRRHLGRSPLSELPGIRGSPIDSRLEYATAVHLFSLDQCTAELSRLIHDQLPAAAPEIRGLAAACGGHPRLMREALQLLHSFPNQPSAVRMARLYDAAQPVFTSIWDATDTTERFILLAAATIQCAQLKGLEAPRAWLEGVSGEGWNQIKTELGLFIDELAKLRILDEEQNPRLFSPLFAVWLVRLARAQKIAQSATLEEKLQLVVRGGKNTYLAALDQLWQPFYKKITEKGIDQIIGVVLSSAPAALARLLAAHLGL